ncbi:uncharacterized protein LOC132933260 [Metopolophium dirhodum]|uniref:uncharacterized protein LOC132933260 n=1 Tax=Metopolophium dirhodum TaxID=44670 RepID=UPI00298F7CF8|nr:uncharacterized protein LOC132933260 [Metopolophium dirhodum]
MAHIINNFMSILTIAVVFSVALAAPNKDTSEPSDETAQSESSITNNNDFVSESASIGGFNAASSLADNGSAMASAGGNDLGASGPGGTVAGAEFINVSELASNEMLMKPATEMLVKPATETLVKPAIVVFYLFDKIFNIPINVLQYINTYLNQKQMHRGQSGIHLQ